MPSYQNKQQKPGFTAKRAIKNAALLSLAGQASQAHANPYLEAAKNGAVAGIVSPAVGRLTKGFDPSDARPLSQIQKRTHQSSTKAARAYVTRGIASYVTSGGKQIMPPPEPFIALGAADRALPEKGIHKHLRETAKLAAFSAACKGGLNPSNFAKAVLYTKSAQAAQRLITPPKSLKSKAAVSAASGWLVPGSTKVREKNPNAKQEWFTNRYGKGAYEDLDGSIVVPLNSGKSRGR